MRKQKQYPFIIHKKMQLECSSIQLYDTVINYVEHSKFLGVWLDKNLKWSIHTKTLANK
jgi:hypothetical protein